jgi:hypothetical protein
MNVMKIPVIVSSIWLKQLSHLIMLRSKVVRFIGIPWNLFSVVSLHQAILNQINSDQIRQEDMVIIFQHFLPQLLLLRRMSSNRHYSKLIKSNQEMILVFYNPKMMDLSSSKMFHFRQKTLYKTREVAVPSLKCTWLYLINMDRLFHRMMRVE